jgi:hypothetical protein
LLCTAGRLGCGWLGCSKGCEGSKSLSPLLPHPCQLQLCALPHKFGEGDGGAVKLPAKRG